MNKIILNIKLMKFAKAKSKLNENPKTSEKRKTNKQTKSKTRPSAKALAKKGLKRKRNEILPKSRSCLRHIFCQ